MHKSVLLEAVGRMFDLYNALCCNVYVPNTSLHLSLLLLLTLTVTVKKLDVTPNREKYFFADYFMSVQFMLEMQNILSSSTNMHFLCVLDWSCETEHRM